MDSFIYIQFVLLVLVFCVPENTSSMSKEEKNELREKVLEMFNHGYRSYMDYAYPADELMPLSCKGRYRGVQRSRGDVDDILGNYTLTLIDALDTLVVLGEVDEFERAARLIIQGVNFDNDIVVSVFEANIRVLGGLLGGHVMAKFLKSRKKGMEWYRDELLDKAKDIGNRLLPAFNTTTGIPYPRVNLRYGVKHVMSRTGSEKDTCTACAGTMILELSALSRLSGDPIYEEKARKAMNYLWQSRHRTSDLVGTVINIHNGDWVRRDSGVGAGIDSYYEYLLKAYILLGDETYLDRFNKHYAAIRKYINQGPLLVDVHMHKPMTNSRNFMDALLAFWPGLQVLIGDMKPAIETHEMLYQVMQRHNFLPEAFTTDFRVHWAQHPLRPEFLESTYFLFKATGDDHYLEVGKEILANLEQHARVKCGYAAIKDVTTGTHEDQMDSYVLAETFKYLYLLFSEPDHLVLNIDNFIFTTEAHLLPLSLSTHNRTQNGTRMPEIDLLDVEDKNYERTCPNTNHVFQADYVKSFRDPLKNMVDISCPASQTSRRPRLKASEFMAGNKAQLEELTRMGISVITMKDGRVQLLHTAADAKSSEDAEDGMMFMQEMIELSKNQVSEAAQHEVCVLQYMIPPFVGVQTINAGPAQFGHDLKKQGQVKGQLILAEPFKACQSLDNEKEIYGKVVVMERGDCMFVDKARQIQGAGAIAGIVIDSHEGTTSSSQPLFAMSGDGRDDIIIPMVFLFHVEGQELLKAYHDFTDLVVYLNNSPKKSEDVLTDLLSDSVQRERIQAMSSSDLSSLQETTASSQITTDKEETTSSRQRHLQDISGDTGDKIPSSRQLVADVVAELTEHTNFQSLGKASSYLSAITKMMEAISKGNYNIMDADSLEHLEDLTQQLKPKVKDVTSADREADKPTKSTYKDAFAAEMNQAVDTFIIQELQRVVDEASGLMPKGASTEQPGDDPNTQSDTKEEELKSYATPEELAGGVPEGGVFEKSGQRYLPPNVEQAPDWMELDSGQVVIGNDGHVYADLKDSYWDWAREDGKLPPVNEKAQSDMDISSSEETLLKGSASIPDTGPTSDQSSTSQSQVPHSSQLKDSSSFHHEDPETTSDTRTSETSDPNKEEL